MVGGWAGGWSVGWLVALGGRVRLATWLRWVGALLAALAGAGGMRPSPCGAGRMRKRKRKGRECLEMGLFDRPVLVQAERGDFMKNPCVCCYQKEAVGYSGMGDPLCADCMARISRDDD